MTLCTLIPLAWLSGVAMHEFHALIAWLKGVDKTGFAFPETLGRLPVVVVEPLREWWNDRLGLPRGPGEWLRPALAEHAAGTHGILKGVALSTIQRLAALAFALVMWSEPEEPQRN